jgi:hypothetical protein
MKGAKTHFPFFRWIVRVLTGRRTRGVCVDLLLLVLCYTAVARLRSYFMARKIQAVLRGLAEVRIDRTTEDQLLKSVPYLQRKGLVRPRPIARVDWIETERTRR